MKDDVVPGGRNYCSRQPGCRTGNWPNWSSGWPVGLPSHRFHTPAPSIEQTKSHVMHGKQTSRQTDKQTKWCNNKRTNKCMSKENTDMMNKRIKTWRWMNERTNGRTNEQTNKQTIERTNKQTNDWTKGWTKYWMNERLNERTNKRTDKQTN